MAAGKFLLAIAVLCLQASSSYAVKVSEGVCTKDADDQCIQTPNAECDNDNTEAKCQCSSGYEEDSADGSTCVLKRVSDVECTKETSDQCTQTPNAECNNAETAAKCQCSNGYKEVSTDGSTCVPKRVSEKECAKDATDQCTKTPNAECNNDDSAAKCQCSNGYKEDSTDGKTCVAIIGSSCTGTGTGTCPANTNTACVNDKCACADGYGERDNVCKRIIGSDCTGTGTGTCPANTNTACVNKKCACADRYGEKDNVCKLIVSETECNGGDECDKIENAECDGDTKKCKCSPNFVMNVDTCVPENAGASTRVGAVTLVLSVFTAIQVMLR